MSVGKITISIKHERILVDFSFFLQIYPEIGPHWHLFNGVEQKVLRGTTLSALNAIYQRRMPDFSKDTVSNVTPGIKRYGW